MQVCMNPPPFSAQRPVTDTFHGMPVTDPYRWLEDQNSPDTRAWIEDQTRYARTYLDMIPGRDRIRDRISEFLSVETHDSVQKIQDRYFFRKRLPNQEQACIYMRDGADGDDQLLIDPSSRGVHTAIKPLRVSPDNRLLLYEVKQGGERAGTFELLEIETRRRLPDVVPSGYLRGFVFAPDGKRFWYAHEALEARRPFYRAAYEHVLGTPFTSDREIFFAGEDEKIRLGLFADGPWLVLFVTRFLEKALTDIYVKPLEEDGSPVPFLQGIDYRFGLKFLGDRILAITDCDAPNGRIVEVRIRGTGEHTWTDLVPESDVPIESWCVAGNQILVSYRKEMTPQIFIFDDTGKKMGEMQVRSDETLRIVGASAESDELLFESESFTEPVAIFTYSTKHHQRTLWAKASLPFDSENYGHYRVWYPSKDGTNIPMFLVGHKKVLAGGSHPTVMTSYGGYGIAMTPQFSVFVAVLMEQGCLFALPNIRGGSEFGVEWHKAAKRRNRQTAYDDFLGAAEWLVGTGRTSPGRLAIFGGSNSGLLVGAAVTQRPDLFCAVVCMVPILDMLRYHLFDNAHVWRDEFGTADDPDDFAALVKYSPYHNVHQGVAYPATMIVSGDADRNCNPLHARKMTARLQAANVSDLPILLDYSRFRGHSPVLPLQARIGALTDRLAFLCDQLKLSI